MALTKLKIIQKISDNTILSPLDAKDTIEELLEIMKSTLELREDIMITGFGKFQVNEKAPRKGRNPATGEAMMLDGRRTVTFRCSGMLNNRLNKI